MLQLARIRDPNVWRLYAATLIVAFAYGISVSLTALHLDAQGFGKQAIGTLAAWFAAGLVVLSIPVGALIRRWSAKRVLMLALLGYALTAALFPWLDSYAGLATIRFFDGACSVAVWVSSETILLKRSEPDHKAFTTSLYAVAIAVGYVVGPLLASGIVSIAPLAVAFGAAGALAATSALYVALRLEPDARELSASAGGDRRSGGSTLALLGRIKNSCFATFAYGYFQATVVLFLPLFLIESKNISRQQTIVIPAFFAAGMLLFSSLAGRAGDRLGHLAVMRALAIVGTTMILGFVFLDDYAVMCAAVFTAGASLATISPVSLALQGVQCEPSDYSRATGIYNTFYAMGILLGPPVAGQIFARQGGETMLYHLAALWTTFIIFSVLYARDDPKARHVPAPDPPAAGV